MRRMIFPVAAIVLVLVAFGLYNRSKVPGGATNSRYQLVLVEDSTTPGQQKLAIQYCLALMACNLMGYRWDPSDPDSVADAKNTYNYFVNPAETKVLSVIKTEDL